MPDTVPSLQGGIAAPSTRAIPDRSRPDSIGPFALLEEIGRGGAGVVYRARQAFPERQVALKLLSGLRFASDRERERFASEAAIASRLEHPGIVPVFEVGELEGQAFYTMALIEGGNLKDRLADGPLEPDEAIGLLLELCSAVSYAHRRGIVHRDLKPENVLFDDSGHSRITDFGLAKDIEAGSELTKTGEILGTPSYMAPEQISGEGGVGPETDVYALGCVLYACLTGRPPFRAASLVATLRQVLDAVPVPPRLANPAVPRDLDAICMRCLERVPEDRYASADELAEDLEAFREGRPVKAADDQTHAFVRLLLQESRHTEVMARWSGIGRVHAVLAFALFAATGVLALLGVSPGWIFTALWLPGGLAAVVVPVVLRKRLGPLDQVERQLAQVWSIFGIVAGITTLSHLIAGAPPADIAPVILAEIALAIGCMSVILRGTFYSLAVAYAACALAVSLTPFWALGPLGASVSVLHFLIARKSARHRGPAQEG